MRVCATNVFMLKYKNQPTDMPVSKLKYLPVVLLILILIVFTIALTVTTRKFELVIDPVLFCWAIIFLAFCVAVYKTWLSVITLPAPLLILSLLPVFGFPEVQNNPNNQNLLAMHFYYIIALYLVVAMGALSKNGKQDA
jgi:hypothetical protein